jgi:thymidylate synthase
MYLTAETLDDLLHSVFEELIKPANTINVTKGDTKEFIGNLLVLKNPRARLSRTETRGKAFSAIGELLWYLSKSNDLQFIEHYLPEYKKYKEQDFSGKDIIYGGYGPRLFDLRGQNQIENILKLLKIKPSSRRAVIQIYDAKDISEEHEDIPCTCTLQFFIREEKLCMYSSMRSNDAFVGLPHDIFAFTMIQEMIARSLDRDIGQYYHSVGSLHIYDKDLESIKKYLDEGWQGTKQCMPEMPYSCPWTSTDEVLKFETMIRVNPFVDLSESMLDDYWKDIIRLLQIHAFLKKDNIKAVAEILCEIKNEIYIIYIKERIRNKNGKGRISSEIYK